MADGLGLDPWWNEPAYKTCNTFHLRGVFIFQKLREHDPARFREARKGSAGPRKPSSKRARLHDWMGASMGIAWR